MKKTAVVIYKFLSFEISLPLNSIFPALSG